MRLGNGKVSYTRQDPVVDYLFPLLPLPLFHSYLRISSNITVLVIKSVWDSIFSK